MEEQQGTQVTVSDAARAMTTRPAPASREQRKGMYGTAYTADALAAFLTVNADGAAQYVGVHDGRAYFTTRTARWNYRAHVVRSCECTSAGTATVRTARVQTVDAAKLATALLRVADALAVRYDLVMSQDDQTFNYPMTSVEGTAQVQEMPGVALAVRGVSLDDVCDDVTSANAALLSVVGWEDAARKMVNAAAQAALRKMVQTVNAQAASRTTDKADAMASMVAALRKANAVARDDDAGADAYSAAENALSVAWTAFNAATAPAHVGLVDLDSDDASDDDDDDDAK